MQTKGVAAEAIKIHTILKQVGIEPPVDVKEIAFEISKARFPDDPVSKIIGDSLPGLIGDSLPGLEGALIPIGDKKGWAILYNEDVTSTGRINFTLAHEFGHYLLHRGKQQQFECGDKDMLAWDSDYGQIEAEANRFASFLLMPIDDYKAQIHGDICMETFKHCADRYQVSLTAAILKWLEFTSKKAILVVSREGYMLWAWSSKPAFDNYLFYKTSVTPPLPVPVSSLVAKGVENLQGETLAANTWWPDREVKEMTLLSEYHDMAFSLLIF